MGIKFIHSSDLHLGETRYNVPELKFDFLNSFRELARYAKEQNVDFVLVCGDFFNKQRIDPEVLEGAMEVLSIFRDAKIEVIVIEGNHDASIYSDEISWLHFLSKRGYLKLLQTKFRNGQPVISEWNPKTGVGSYLDIGSIRLYGVGYLGASTKKKLELIEPVITPKSFTIMLLHASIDYFLHNDLGGVRKEDVDIFKNKVKYLALGHIHQRYEREGWIFNPGGLENWRINEAEAEKGYFLVEIEDNEIKEVKFKKSIRRPIYRFTVDISDCKDSHDVRIKIMKLIEENKVNIQIGQRPIISITYVGKVKFSTLQIDNENIKKQIEENLDASICVISDGVNILTSTGEVSVLPSRNDIEKEEIEKLLDLYPLVSDKKDLVVGLIRSFKTKALTETDESELIGLVVNNASAIKK